jgi:DeoR/GlpR family transcriptional regulator of sugar metabolism
MSRAMRQTAILERIEREGGASVSQLAGEFGVSPITIHRDLEQLAGEKLVVRVHGGARSLARGRAAVESDFTKRLQESRPLKQAIAARAAAWVEDGATIFVDASTTGLELARHLELNPPNSLTLLTNSPAIAHELSCSAIHVIVAPGEVDQNLRVIGGQWTVEFLQGLNVAVAFISCFGITLERGLTTGQRNIADTLTAAGQGAERTIALVDSTKFGRSGLLTIARPQEVDAIVVDALLPEFEHRAYAAAGVNLVIAPLEPGG